MAKKPVPESRPLWMTGLIQAGSLAGALIAIGTVWHLLGLPTPAWSTDLQKLDQRQTEIAIDIYQRAVRGQLATPAPTDPVAKQNWDEELRQNRQKLDEAINRRLQLSK